VSESSNDAPAAPEGWYPVGDGSTETYWTGSAWTNATRTMQVPAPRTASLTLSKRVLGWAVLVVGVVGGALACFTQVSLLTGTGTVWVGVVIAALALVVGAVARAGRWFVVVLAVVVALALATAIYDEVQLAHKRHELSHLVGG